MSAQFSVVPPLTADALIDRGVQAQQSGDLSTAAEHYERALELERESFDALQLLGLVHIKRGEFAEGIRLLERAIEVNPREVGVLNNLGGALHDCGLIREAVHILHRALAIDPGYVPALLNLASSLMQVSELRFAAKCLARIRERDPHNVSLPFLQGRLLHALGRPIDAISAYREAQARGIDSFGLHRALALALQDIGHEADALAAFRAAERVKPSRQIQVYRAYSALQLCAWDGFAHDTEVLSAPLDPLADPVCPLRILLFPVPGARLREYVEDFARCSSCAGQWLEIPAQPAAFTPRAPLGWGGRRLRVGYLSPDFRDHAVGYLMTGVLEAHDRGAFEIFAYASHRADAGTTRARIARASEHFSDLSELTDQALLGRLRRDDLDILVDLAGYTAHSRPRVLSARTARIQVNWLGYPGTMGAPFMDYIFADDFIIPSGHEAHFTEQVVRLPHTYLPYDRSRSIGAPRSRADYGLPEEAVVLACFGQVRKINPPVFAAWMDVMRSVPQAVLWLTHRYPPVIANLRREAEARGVSSDRLIFAGPVPEVADHLARYRVVDVALDTFPYGSHSTAADALWVGCPLVALVGDSFAARVSGSVLRAAGVPELSTYSLEQYRDLILELARDSARRESIRARLEANRMTCPLFDTPRFVRGLEQAYFSIHERSQRELAPGPLTVGAAAPAAGT
jgi:predicted O-linked N-acetylglucosamine transferase (SPINDLY family)